MKNRDSQGNRINPPTYEKSITQGELVERLHEGCVQLIHVLSLGPGYEYAGSIQGSKEIPFPDLKERLGELDKKKEIVTYGAGTDDDPASQAAEFLETKGFKVRVYEGGVKEWKKAGLPMSAPNV